MAIFSKKRNQKFPQQSHGSGQKIKRYLLYAIGEIILVVIGILIAVGINDWNEDKKEAQRLNVYLNDYRNDLMIDSATAGSNLRILELKREAFELVLSDTMTKASLTKTPMVFSLVTTYSPLKLQSKGYNELNTYVANNEMTTDSLVMKIVAEHMYYDDLLNNTVNRISEDIDNNLEYFKENKPWLADLLKNRMTEEILDYYVSDDYRNRVAIHQMLVYGNLERFLKFYLKYIEETLKLLDRRLAKN